GGTHPDARRVGRVRIIKRRHDRAKNEDPAWRDRDRALGGGDTRLRRCVSIRGRLDPVGTSADDLVKALDAQASTDATVSAPSLNGLAWKRVDLAQAPGLDRATCRHGAGGPLQIWADSEENGYYALAPDTIGTVLTTEVDGARVVVVSTIDGRATSADRAALEDVIASLEVVG